MTTILPIQRVVITLTDVNDNVSDFTLDAPNGNNPFEFVCERLTIRPRYRDRNKIMRLGKELYHLSFDYSYESHEMDLRYLLTSKEIALKAPPDFTGDYQTYSVMFENQEAIKNYFGGLAMAGETEEAVESGQVNLTFRTITPLEWDALLQLDWYESVPES